MIDKNWLVGFVEGEGTFVIGIFKSKNSFMVIPKFSIELHEKDREILEKIKDFFNVGYVKKISKDNESYKKRNSKPLYIPNEIIYNR